MDNSPPTASIHILDDYSLLNSFYLYRPAIFDGDDDSSDRVRGGKKWSREEWWYKLAHVCQRWRNLILGSASYLGLCLVCTDGTPVSDMLAHSPPLPLIIDYDGEGYDVTVEDEEGIVLALEQCDRIRRIRLFMPASRLEKLLLLMAIYEEYPILEYMIIEPSMDEDRALTLPETLQAPNLHHLALYGFVFPTGSRLPTTAIGLVTFYLYIKPPFTDFRPTVLLQWLSSMPQLETLVVYFSDGIPNRDVERKLMRTSITTQVTLPNLRRFLFQGGTAYLEALVCRITAPSLEELGIYFFQQLTFSVPHLLQFINTTENSRFGGATFRFLEGSIIADVFFHGEAEFSLSIVVLSWNLDWQVSSIAQISDSLSQKFPVVEHLAFEHDVHDRSSEEHNEVDRTEWRKLLGSFSKVKTLHIDHGLVGELSRILRPDSEELPLELLPELQELTVTGSDDISDAFTPFIDARQNAGHPVTLARSPGVSNSSSSSASVTTSLSSEATVLEQGTTHTQAN